MVFVESHGGLFAEELELLLLLLPAPTLETEEPLTSSLAEAIDF